MKAKLIFLIFLFPAFIKAQEIKNGAIIFDMHPKKNAPDTTTTQQQQTYPSDDEEDQEQKSKKGKIVKPPKEQNPTPSSVKADWAKYGLFQALFHVGFNACQVDGDGYSGYNYLGAEFGIGALIKVHRLLSVSMEFNYTMKGAKQDFRTDSLSIATSTQQYQVQFDYLEVPLALNINAVTPKNKQVMLLTLGLAPAVLIRFKEINEDGQNVTNYPPPEGYPHRFDLSAFGGIYFIIHRNYAIGGKFSYSITKIRGPNINGLTRLFGEYNNDLTVDFMYILDTAKKNNKRKTNL
jgi:hypothetical protein